MSFKPLETEYKGYRFRSRLEARWAVFFDECGFKWEYEPEGYDIDGVHYLPDFRLYDVQRRLWGEDEREKPFFVEVKGEMDEASRDKIWSLSRYCPVYVVGNVPYSQREKYFYHTWDYWRPVVDEFDKDVMFFSYNTIDGDSYPAGLFVNKQGKPEIVGPDHDQSNIYGGIEES